MQQLASLCWAAEQTDSCPGGGSRVAFRAFQHLYKTSLLHAEGPEGGEGGRVGSHSLLPRLWLPRQRPPPCPGQALPGPVGTSATCWGEEGCAWGPWLGACVRGQSPLLSRPQSPPL